MQGVLEGFATICVIIALGMALAHWNVLDRSAAVMLPRLAFFVATPALMITVLGSSDVTELFSRNLAVSAVAVGITGVLYLVVARLLWRKTVGELVIGTMSAVYVNAVNLGIPIAAYVLGDASLVAPMLLMQLLVLQPVAFAILDNVRLGNGFSVGLLIRRPLTNPLTLASLLGVFLSVTGLELPTAIEDPLRLVGGMAVPAMLIAYGVSLRLGPRPAAGPGAAEIGYIAVLKLLVLPLVAYVVARFAFGLEDKALLAVTVTAALPTAQNIFVHATRYGQGVLVARDAIFVTTILSLPVLFVIAAVVP